MSIWTYSALACALVLGGCGAGQGTLSFLPGKADVRASGTGPLTSADVANGAITLTAPTGYCIDRASLRRGNTGGFAAMSPCAPPHERSARAVSLITATVMPAKGLTVPPGAKSLLSLDKDARLLRDASASGLTLALIDSRSAPPLRTLSPRHWRGVFLMDGRIVGLALYAHEGSVHLRGQGANLLSELARNTRAAAHGAQTTAPLPARSAPPKIHPRPRPPRDLGNQDAAATPQAKPGNPSLFRGISRLFD